MLKGFERVQLEFGQILYEPAVAIPYVYFPGNSLVSLIVVVDQRAGLEVGMVGKEGMVGLPLAAGRKSSPVRALVQGAGYAMRMSARRFGRELDGNGGLREELSRYLYASMATAMQIAACNRVHLLGARLARWLLMTRDRLGRNDFLLTQEFLALMLGVRRAGVTDAAGTLQRRGLIRYSRGAMKIVDVEGVRALSCSCYAVIRTLDKRG
jgi:CRP-like cAMP-binding protein